MEVPPPSIEHQLTMIVTVEHSRAFDKNGFGFQFVVSLSLFPKLFQFGYYLCLLLMTQTNHPKNSTIHGQQQ